MSGWPELPSAGELVRLALPLPPPTLCQAAGCSGGGQLVAMHWSRYGDELIITDGTITTTRGWPAWTTLVQHPLGAAILGPYVGVVSGPAAHVPPQELLGFGGAELQRGGVLDQFVVVLASSCQLILRAEITGAVAKGSRRPVPADDRWPPKPIEPV
ncbi:MAG: hypothetical protein ACLP50_06160 [Solirubrobacteraceae bacterium]